MSHLPVIQHCASFHNLEEGSNNALVLFILHIFNWDPPAW